MSASSFPFPLRRLDRDWSGETALVIGNGTSVEDIDPLPIRAFQTVGRVLVMNSGVHTYPKADVLVCADRKWLKDTSSFDPFKGGEIITTQPSSVGRDLASDSRLGWMKRCFVDFQREAEVAFDDPETLVEGHTSVSTAISIAAHRGVRRIIIIGLDLRPGAQRKRRAGDDTPDIIDNARRRYAKQALHLGKQANLIYRKGIQVINCSPPSIFKTYPMGDLMECIRMAHIDSPRRLR